MTTASLRMAGVFTVYDSAVGTPAYDPDYGDGSNYTYVLIGSVGDTATISGGVAGDSAGNFVPIANLVIGSDGAPVRTTVRHCFPQLNVTHTGRLIITRSK